MGVTWYEERCPHCRKVVYSDSVERDICFGNSIATCFHCNKQFIDSKVYEWVNLNNEQKKGVLVMGTNMVIVTEAEIRSTLKKFGFTKYLIVGAPAVHKMEENLKKFENFKYFPEMLMQPEIQASIERTSDENYLRLLLKAGRNYYGEKIE